MVARTKKASKAKGLSLEAALWNCRVALRGVGSMEKNRDAIISLVFLKFAGDKFEKRRAKLVEQYGEMPAFLEKPSFYNADNVFYLDKESRWTFIVKHAADNDIAVKIDTAMAKAEERNPSLKVLFRSTYSQRSVQNALHLRSLSTASMTSTRRSTRKKTLSVAFMSTFFKYSRLGVRRKMANSTHQPAL